MTKWLLVGYFVVGICATVCLTIRYLRQVRQLNEAKATAQRLAGRYTVSNFSRELNVLDLVRDGVDLSTVVFKIFDGHCVQEQLDCLLQGAIIELQYNSLALGLEEVPVNRYERFLQINFV